jgi:hypothetical protein
MKQANSDDNRDENGFPRGIHVSQHYGREEGSNSKLIFWFLGGLMAINVALMGTFMTWVGSAIVALQTDVAVIKCQLSPDCQKVATNAKP